MAGEKNDLADFDVTDDEAWAKMIADGDVEAEQPDADAEQDNDGSVLDLVDVVDEPEPAKGRERAKEPERDPDDTHPAKATVPLHQLLDERDKRKSLEKRLAELEAASAPKVEPTPVPDPLTDPDGYREWDERRFASIQQERQVEALQSHYAMDKLEAFQTVEGYKEQYQALVADRAAELREAFPDATPAQVERQIQIDEVNLAAQAVQAGMRPHQMVKRILDQRNAQARAWAEANGYAAPAGGAAPAPAAPAGIPKDEARARNRSLSSASGTKEPAAALAKMGYEEQGELTDKEWEDQMRRAGLL